MYNTIKDMHIALNVKLQQLNANRELNINPEIMDMYLNRAMFSFIDTKLDRVNFKNKGYEENTARYDSLQELKTTVLSYAYLSDRDNRVYSVLPNNYYHMINSTSLMHYSCKGVNKNSITSANKEYLVLPFISQTVVRTGMTGYYEGFKIELTIDGEAVVVFDLDNYPTFPLLLENDAKFMIINLLLQDGLSGTFNGTLSINSYFKIYYERFGELYYKDSFIIVKEIYDNNVTTLEANITLHVIEDDALTEEDFYDRYVPEVKEIKSNRYDLTSNLESPNELVSSSYIEDMIKDFYTMRNRQYKPLCTIDNNKHIIYESSTFAVTNTYLTYIRRPKLMSLSSNINCEIKDNSEIVDIAVQMIASDLGSQNYQYVVNENKIRN